MEGKLYKIRCYNNNCRWFYKAGKTYTLMEAIGVAISLRVIHTKRYPNSDFLNTECIEVK